VIGPSQKVRSEAGPDIVENYHELSGLARGPFRLSKSKPERTPKPSRESLGNDLTHQTARRAVISCPDTDFTPKIIYKCTLKNLFCSMSGTKNLCKILRLTLYDVFLK
jgi:hypothetical protein